METLVSVKIGGKCRLGWRTTTTHLCCWGIYIRHAWQQMPNVVTKDNILFCFSFANVKLGQKAEQRTKR
jgi:hypothetical protein